jgi:hypothetical protein
MASRGHIKGGAVALDEPAALPDGTQVVVQTIEARGADAGNGSPTIRQKLLQLEATATALPADLPERHDHHRRERLKP